MATRKGKVITIFSTKGGVGKTILTLNLAGIYSMLNKKVLIIDLDLYSGGIAVSLNVDPSNDIYKLVDDLDNGRYTEFKDYVSKYNENIDVLSCPLDPRQGNKINRNYAEIILVNAANRYDVVLVDTAHILSDINLTALDKTDDILLVLSNDPIDLKNMKSIIAIFKDSEIDNYRIVLNEAINTDKDFFTTFDIKNIIRANIDYTISKQFHMHDIDRYIANGKIPVLDKKIQARKKRDIEKLKKMATRLLVRKDGDKHE
ncbi:MAG: AAA family ATPase [Bacilli bacterium]|nr:AAA family ATPase [Bacilli bacterium]MDD4643632.1 AAA family ATPase [Bacilli bacterium]